MSLELLLNIYVTDVEITIAIVQTLRYEPKTYSDLFDLVQTNIRINTYNLITLNRFDEVLEKVLQSEQVEGYQVTSVYYRLVT